MAKKTPVKKSKRRLKRSVRRSLAAVLMITAIGVAAIPVPENYAEEEDGPTVTTDAYTEVYTKPNTGWSYDDVDDANAVYSLDIYDGKLYWQYKVDTKNDKVIQYNSSYPAASLTLSENVPTNYTYVPKGTFDTFVTTTTYTLSTDPKSDDYYYSDTKADRQEAINFFNNYFSEDDDYKAFLTRLDDIVSENPHLTITRGVSQLSNSEQRTYYCSLKLKRKDFILEPVRIEISEGEKALDQVKVTGVTVASGDLVYIPKYTGTVDTDDQYEMDKDGYLLYSGTAQFSNTQSIKRVGKYAFAGNGFLKSITLPEWLKSIGEGAFMDCVYLQSVSIPFLSEIPAAAFKNCSNLRTVNWWGAENSSGLLSIGVEAFYGTGIAENSSGQGKIVFPIGVYEIKDAAFYGCGSLTQIEFDLSNGSDALDIRQYAFYDNTALESVNFNKKKVNTLEKYCFAVGVYSNVMSTFTFPDSGATMGDYILANRSNLTKIIVPGGVKKLTPDTILDSCTGLQVAEFLGRTTTYVPKLFNSVMNEDFYVTGPARASTDNPTSDNVSDASGPRMSTWDAEKTAADQYIPYLYTIGGREYYEICSGDGYLESIDKATGTLTSCDVKDGDNTNTNGELVIPDKVGNTPVTKIASDCFKGKDKISGTVKRLVIGNNIVEIENSVFKSWSKLQEVEIGKGIQKIGNEAFADCQRLENITFATPDNGNYQLLNTIGANAFATNSGKLTIHGDIVEGYLPFEYAVNPDNYVTNSPTVGSATKYRILYQSRWDSPSSKHMSVIYGEYDDGNGYVTLVDYPLHQDFYATNEDGKFILSDDLKEHNRDMERQYYSAYGNYAYPNEEDPNLELKVRFAYDYYKYRMENNESEINTLYENVDRYGPWINPNFCSNYKKWLGPKWLEKYGLESLEVTENSVYDWFFAPITVMAAEIPEYPSPYFEKYPYNFLENYMSYNNGGSGQIPTPVYRFGWTQDEQDMIEAVEKIVIPSGVESIDINAYYLAKGFGQQNVAQNSTNYKNYFGNRGNIFVSNVSDLVDVPTGLFSGNIDDLYDENGTIDQGDNRRGNDRIKLVDMSQSNVLWIPDYAFDNCELLHEVLIPASCTTTGALPFRDCGKMKVLTSDSENVPALNGILYQKKEDATYELVECILGKGMGDDANDKIVRKDFDDPYLSLVSSIGESAFENCQGIQQVFLDCIDGGGSANKLKLIPDYCFRNCNALTDVVLPESAKEVGQYAFADIRKEYYHSKTSPSPYPRLNVTIRGREFNISETAFDPKEDGDLSTICMVTIHTYPDTAAERYALEQIRKGYHIDLDTELSTRIRVNFWDWNGDTLCDTIYLDEGVNRLLEENIPAEVTAIVTEPNHRPGYEFKGWLGYGGAKVGEAIKTDEITYIAQYESDGTMVNGQYRVQFLDGIDGHQLRGYGASKDGNYYVDVGKSFSEMGIDEGDEEGEGWDAPDYADHSDLGYQFLAWSNDWTRDTKINKNMTIVALYEYKPTSGGSTNTPGTGSSGSTQTPGGGGTGGTTSSSKNTTSSSTSSSSTSTSSTTSGSDSTVGKYTVTVINGSGSGNYDVGSTVVIAANEPAAGMVFQKWTTESNGVALASVSLPATTFIMPANNVTVTAEFVAGTNNITGAVGTPAGNTGTTNTGTTNTGNTRVDITKPGISNRDLATANVNGSTDNFIVKITETDEATRAVQDALTNKYGSLENLLYYAMDISLYDSTGTVKISDTTGLSVDITIPIPDALVAYGGNNMAGAVINGNQLENLNESFTTINGVPCIRFRATHFSPYTVYVDTGNLTEGMLDTTPKTGDPIHPKWFLSIGLACLSVILFMKKDKAVKVKTA